MTEPRSEQTLDWLREQWRSQRLFDAAGIGSWVRSADGTQVIWSQGLKKLFGFQPDEQPSMDAVLSRLEPEYRAPLAEAIRLGLETGEVFTAEYRIQRPDGTRRWIEATAQWIQRSADERPYLQGIAKDVTDRKSSELRRQDSERRFAALVEGSADVLLRFSADFSQMLHVIGRDFVPDIDEPTSDWLESRLLEADREYARAAIAAARADGRKFEIEHRVYRRDGTVGWARTRIVPLRMPDGRIAEWVGMATDITDAKHLSVELDRYKKHLEELVETRTRSLYDASRANELLASRLEMACRAARIGTWYASFRDGTTIWDERMYELFGLHPSEGESGPSILSWYRRVHAGDRKFLRREAGRGSRLRLPTDFDVRVTLPDGARRTLRVTSLVECDALGMPIRIVGTCEDVTADRQTALELQEAKSTAEAGNVSKSKFIAAASHDLRQPLAAVNLYLDILKDAVPSGLPASLVARIRTSTESLGAMLDGLLDVARLDASAVQVRLTMIPLGKLERWVREEFAEQFRVRGLQLRLCFPRRDLLLHTDETFIKGILRNLLVNALKFTAQGGVLVGLRLQGQQSVFQVWDSGIGIDAAHVPHVFEEFYQAGNPARDSAKGLGLGLSIVRREAHLLGGTVGCRSRPGRGTVFDVVLPREQFLASRADDVKASSDSGEFPLGWVADCRVCLIEDAPAVREALALLLGSWGMRVAAYPDADSALESPELVEADFVITDFRLPGSLNGIELLQELRRRQIRPVRSIVLTGEIDLPECKDPAGWPWPILRKPCDQRLLWKALTG